MACLSMSIAIPLQAADPNRAEKVAQIFQDAKTYTVKIKANVKHAFVEDSTGEGIGAGFVVDPAKRWILTNAHVSNRNP